MLNGQVSPSTVLIAEDDADIQMLLLLALRNAGFVAEGVDGGIDALASARRDNYQAVVLDIRMPDMSGLEVCRQLKADDDVTSAILLISANCSSEDVEEGYAAGADDYLPKPFSPRELVERVGLLIARGANHDAQSG